MAGKISTHYFGDSCDPPHIQLDHTSSTIIYDEYNGEDEVVIIPVTYEQALDIVLAEMREIMLDRHRKYGPNNILRGDVHGLITRIGDKLARIEEDHKYCSFKVCKWDNVLTPEDREFTDETAEDAWLDLANYAGPIGIMLQRGWWELPLDPGREVVPSI